MDARAQGEPEGLNGARLQPSAVQLSAKSRRSVLLGGLGALSASALLRPSRSSAATPDALRRAERAQRSGSFVPFPARLPAPVGGAVARFSITVEDRTIEIAPGVRIRAWTFNGRVPGPVLHVRQGQPVEVTFHNRGTMAHSFDLHAARVAAGTAFRDIQPGKSMTLAFTAHDPGVFVYHCVTSPAVMHIAAGMYGAMVVTPSKPLPATDHEFVLVGSEWYLSGSGQDRPADVDFDKALAMRPDVVTFNGYASQYVDHALRVPPGKLARFYVGNAGPNLAIPFHVVGTVFERVYIDGDVTTWLSGVQTTSVAPGAGAIFDVRFEQAGANGFVNHSFANAFKGAQGTILVGDATGRMTH
jgi:nitrite reductase (NO-forming)